MIYCWYLIRQWRMRQSVIKFEMNHYRKIYEEHYGLIPVDEQGRTYDIHHLDGNHSNNDISNLKAVSIKEHYEIHLAKEDWGACYLIMLRMNSSPSELSEMSKKTQRKLVENGTHVLLNGEMQRRIQLEKVENGTHHLLSGKIQRETAQKRISEGTHNFQTMSAEDRSVIQKNRLMAGIHPFQKSDHYEKVRNAVIGNKNVNYNPTIFQWTNSFTHEKISCTINELCKSYKLDTRNVSAVAKGRRKIHKGWQIMKDKEV